MDSDSVVLGWGLKFCFSNKFPVKSCCWSKDHTSGSRVLRGAVSNGEVRIGSAVQALGGRKNARKVVLGAMIASQCPHFLPIAIWWEEAAVWAACLF